MPLTGAGRTKSTPSNLGFDFQRGVNEVNNERTNSTLIACNTLARKRSRTMTATVTGNATAYTHIRMQLSEMSLQDKIGQMSQIDISLLLDNNNESNHTQLEHYFGTLGIGSLLNTPLSRPSWTAKQYRSMMIDIQDIAKAYNRPPVIWGLDSVHGANYIRNTILTPQPINLAATFNITTSKQAGRRASRDTRAAGITWLFSPLVGLALDPRWARVYETFGEDPLLVGQMAAAMIAGIQEPETPFHESSSKIGEISNKNQTMVPSRAAACAKHFVGYSLPNHGHDRAPSWIPTRHLYQYFVPPWRDALDTKSTYSNSNGKVSDINTAAAMTVMESYTETGGVPNVANSKTLYTLLRQQLDFDGVLVTDFKEIINLQEWHGIVNSSKEASVRALSEGSVDVSMIPFDPDGYRSAITDAVQSKTLDIKRINSSVERVLRLKEKLRMMDETLHMNDPILQHVGQGRDEALSMAHQSIVLVENNNKNSNIKILPLDPRQPLHIHVTGPTSNSLSFQSGGWTWQWQGVPDNETDWFSYGTTVVGGIANTTTTWNITASCGVNILGSECDDRLNKHGDANDGKYDNSSEILSTVESWIGLDNHNDAVTTTDGTSIQRAAKQASYADVVVVCVGEGAYAEKNGDIRTLALPDGQYELVKAIHAKKNDGTKLILVYFGGRPRLLQDMVDLADAMFIAFLPGPDAGRALANLMAGVVNPSGRLPMTYPKYEDGGGAPYFHAVSDQCSRNNTYAPCVVQWPFGHGLSYTTFEYSDISTSSDRLYYSAVGQERDDSVMPELLTVSITVKNTGSLPGSESVLFFTFDESRHVTPEMKRLRFFEKVFLEVGQERIVTATLSANDPHFQFVGPHDDSHLILQNGMQFRVGVGVNAQCRGASALKESNTCSRLVTIDTGDDYIGACDVACRLWKESGCAHQFDSLEQCWTMCNSSDSGRSLPNGEDGW